jgi:FkbM family methyltransferase
MTATMLETVARSVGNMRFGRRAIPGQGRMADAIGRVAGWMSGGRGVASPWPGVRFEADLCDRIQRQMWAGVYEPHVRECLDALLKPGDVYIDVGAHIGFHAATAAYRVGAEGRVFAFEADPAVHGRLARNLAQFPWAQAVHGAVWEHSGTLAFERSSFEQESGWGTLCNVRDLGKGEHVNVRAVSLDDWCRETQIVRVDVMKIDAEGSELAVLRGAQRMLDRFHPAIVLEINGILLEQTGTSATKIVDFLMAGGYTLYYLSFRQLRRWELSTDADFSESLCLPAERAANALPRLADAGFENVD